MRFEKAVEKVEGDVDQVSEQHTIAMCKVVLKDIPRYAQLVCCKHRPTVIALCV